MGFLLIKWEEREGLKAKGPLIPSPPDAEQGRRPGSPAAANPAATGHGGGRDYGGKEEGATGI